MSNVNMIIRIYVYMHILTVEPSRARGLKHLADLVDHRVLLVEPSRARGLKPIIEDEIAALEGRALTGSRVETALARRR